ncbi:MAG: hypothetical protein FJX92_08890 [Bacteroidetes bacterium]|nr:hypothetical protein [Bacteroidota bacterium]
MNHQEFVSEIKKRLKVDENCKLHGIWERHPERRNGSPIPSSLLEITVYSYFTRTIVRVGCQGPHTRDEVGTQLKIDVCSMEIQQEVIHQYNEPFYRFSYRTAYNGDFQKKDGAIGEIDFEKLLFVLRDQTPLNPYL